MKSKLNGRPFCIFGLFGAMFAFFQMTGYGLEKRGNLIWDGSYLARLLLVILVVSILCGTIGSILCCFAGGISDGGIEGVPGEDAGGKSDGTAGAAGGIGKRKGMAWNVRPLYVWLLSFAGIALCRLPGYLAYYPGICAYDTTIQMGQVSGGFYNDHHPIAHTLLLKLGTDLGKRIFGSVNTGLGLITLVQMLLLAGVMAWGITLVVRRTVRRWIPVALQLLAMLYPFHAYMSISVCKDILFSAFFLLQMLALCEMIRGKAGLGRYDILFAAGAIGMQLFRNNGRYAMLVLWVFLAAAVCFGKAHRRFWVRLTVNTTLCLVAGSLLLSGLFRVTGAEQGDRREMLSMPIQQLARTMLYHGGVGVLAEDDGTMKKEDRALINDFLLDEAYREYRPDIADPVKRHTNTYVVRYRTEDFARTYLGLLADYPGDFINAALAVNAGYFYVGDESHAHINENGTDTGLGYVQTRFLADELGEYGIVQASRWRSLYERMERWADQNAYLKLPIIKYLFVPGVFLWCYLLFAAILLWRRQYDGWIPLALVFGYYATLILGPTVQLRYIYPLMITLPFVVVLGIRGGAEVGK